MVIPTDLVCRKHPNGGKYHGKAPVEKPEEALLTGVKFGTVGKEIYRRAVTHGKAV